MPEPLMVVFSGGTQGAWSIESMRAVSGKGLPEAQRLGVHEGALDPPEGSLWTLKGVVGHTRYTGREELEALRKVQPTLGRPEAICGALIPIKKNSAWWDLAQDERRRIFEEQSHHIGQSMDYLPAIARRLHHSRDLGEPFDFLTWFEFAPEHAGRFEDLLEKLRKSEEWKYVEREVEVRLRRNA